MKKTFDNQSLHQVSHCCGILRACTDIPFAMANKINGCKIAADGALERVKQKLELIRERKADEDITKADMAEVLKEKSEIEIPELKEAEFTALNITGDKEVVQLDGTIKKFNYRDAYFNLLGVVILP